MKAEALEQAIRAEAKDLWHNAKIHRFPEFESNREEQLFWDCLGDEVRFNIENLQEIIKERFGFDLHLYSYGRSGATIAPSEWLNPAACSSFGGLNLEIIYTPGWGYGGLEAHNGNRKILACLKFINRYWRDQAKYIREWWRELKEANEWDFSTSALYPEDALLAY